MYNMLPDLEIVSLNSLASPERLEAARRLFPEGQGLAIIEPFYKARGLLPAGWPPWLPWQPCPCCPARVAMFPIFYPNNTYFIGNYR